MPAKQFITPNQSEWPSHWRRLTDADLASLRAGYERGYLPPHHPNLRKIATGLDIGSVACMESYKAMSNFVSMELWRPAGPVPVGLASNQFNWPGIGGRVIAFDPRKTFSKVPPTHLRIIVDPVIRRIGKPVYGPEGCRSTGRFRAWAERSESVDLEGWQVLGGRLQKIEKERHTGRAAVALQHENGHLNGERVTDLVDDAHLMFASVDEMSEFDRHNALLMSGELRQPEARWLGPRDQWEAAKLTHVFGDLVEVPGSDH